MDQSFLLVVPFFIIGQISSAQGHKTSNFFGQDSARYNCLSYACRGALEKDQFNVGTGRAVLS